MSKDRRTARLNELLREELSRLVRTELKDPRVETATITGVETTSDLSQAKVFVRTLGDEIPPEEAVEGLHSAMGYIRHTLGKTLRLRRIPEFRFVVDSSLQTASRIEELLARVRSEDASGSHTG